MNLGFAFTMGRTAVRISSAVDSEPPLFPLTVKGDLIPSDLNGSIVREQRAVDVRPELTGQRKQAAPMVVPFRKHFALKPRLLGYWHRLLYPCSSILWLMIRCNDVEIGEGCDLVAGVAQARFAYRQ